MDAENKEILTNEDTAPQTAAEAQEPAADEPAPQEAAPEATKEAENASNEPEAQPAEEPAPEDVPAEVAGAKGEEEKKKKDSRLPFIITLIIILLLFSLAIIISTSIKTTDENPDVAVARLINRLNESTRAVANNEYEAYRNAKGYGYVLDIIRLSQKENVILWDEANDSYVLYNGSKFEFSPDENPSTGYGLWIFVNELPESSSYSVYLNKTHTVKRMVEIEGYEEPQERTYTYTEHEYNVTVNSDSRTYTCTEEGCGFTYTVKNAN